MLKLIFLSVNVCILSIFKHDFFSCSLKARNQGCTKKRNDIFIFLKLFCLKWLVYFHFGNELVIVTCVMTLSYISKYTILLLTHYMYACVVGFLNHLPISSYICFWKKKIIYLFAPSRFLSWLRPCPSGGPLLNAIVCI